jgi:hypothetical protein
MRRIALVTILAFGAWGLPCHADPGVWLSWDQCGSGLTNRPFSGPGVYRQVISGFDFAGMVRGYSVRLHVTSSNVYDAPSLVLPDAWRFDRPAGCQAEQLDVGSSAAACPALTEGQMSFAVSYDFDGFDLDITLLAAFDPVPAAPGAQYTLFALDYDHGRSAVGPRDPAEACGEAERRVCFVIRDASWTDANLVAHPMRFEPFMGISWQDDDFGCFYDLAVQPVPWTAAKQLYRAATR